MSADFKIYEYPNPDFAPKVSDSQRSKVFRIDPSKLSKDECHLFCPINLNKEALLTAQMEYMCFHPKTALNEKYHFHCIELDGAPFRWTRFPIEYREACEKMAKVFQLTVAKEAGVYIGYTDTFEVRSLIVPTGQNMIRFEGLNPISKEEWDRELDEIQWAGDVLEKLGIEE